jgi:hypothetical protein
MDEKPTKIVCRGCGHEKLVEGALPIQVCATCGAILQVDESGNRTIRVEGVHAEEVKAVAKTLFDKEEPSKGEATPPTTPPRVGGTTSVARSAGETTRTDRIVQWAKNNRYFSVLIILGILVGAVATVLTNIYNIAEHFKDERIVVIVTLAREEFAGSHLLGRPGYAERNLCEVRASRFTTENSRNHR